MWYTAPGTTIRSGRGMRRAYERIAPRCDVASLSTRRRAGFLSHARGSDPGTCPRTWLVVRACERVRCFARRERSGMTERVDPPANEHVIDPRKIHHPWQKGLEPALVIRSGDVVHYDLLAAGTGEVAEGARIEDVTFDFETIYNLSGPLFVEGAAPGDTLEIQILRLVPTDWGWPAVPPGLGLL